MPQTPSESTPRSRQPRRGKGKERRREILNAALWVIARRGLRGVTHRAVAQAAGVHLSQTTYYFADLQALITEAFQHFIAEGRGNVEEAWRQTRAVMEGLESGPSGRSVKDRRALRERLTALGIEYILSQADGRLFGLEIELSLVYEARMDPRFRALARDYQERLVMEMAALCTQLGSTQPEVDGELLLGVVQRLELSCLDAPRPLEQAGIRRQLHRVLSWVLAIPQEGEAELV